MNAHFEVELNPELEEDGLAAKKLALEHPVSEEGHESFYSMESAEAQPELQLNAASSVGTATRVENSVVDGEGSLDAGKGSGTGGHCMPELEAEMGQNRGT